MTREELKAKLVPLVIAKTNGDMTVKTKIVSIAREWWHDPPNVSQVFNVWNDVMAEIVTEHHLERH